MAAQEVYDPLHRTYFVLRAVAVEQASRHVNRNHGSWDLSATADKLFLSTTESTLFRVHNSPIDHFTVVGLATWPLNGSEARDDLVLIQTSLLLLCKSTCSYANQLAFTWEKQRGLYQSKVTSSLACIHGQVTEHTTVKWSIPHVPDPARLKSTLSLGPHPQVHTLYTVSFITCLH